MSPWILLTLLALAALLAGEGTGRRPLVWAGKPIASAGFVGLAWSVGAAGSPYGRAVLVALALSWLGDVLLIPPSRGAFLGGLVAFLLGHVAYAAGFVILGPNFAVAAGSALALGAAGWAVGRWLLPHVPAPMRLPVVAYIVVISLMVALAAGAWAAGAPPTVAVGALAFYLSDLSVARDRFVARGFVNRAWGLPFYYGAQLLLASTAAG